jgi:branched-chain amino acid transport system permease protein
VNGYTGQFSLGHAGFMAVGAYLGSALSLGIKFTGFPLPEWSSPSIWWVWTAIKFLFAALFNSLAGIHNAIVGMSQVLPPWGQFLVALIYGGLIASLVGFGVGLPSLRLRGDYLAIVTLGFNEIIRSLLENAEPLGAQRGLDGIPYQTTFFWTFAVAAITIYVILTLVHSTYGSGFLAVRDNEIAAEAMGINTTKYKVLAFAIGAFFAGIAGGLYAHYYQHIDPKGFDFLRSVDIVVMVILGGMGSTAGVCIAAVFVAVLPEGLRLLAHAPWVPDWLRPIVENRMILYSLLLIILMISRPQGLFSGLPFLRKKA